MGKIKVSIYNKAKADERAGLDLGDCLLPTPPPPSSIKKNKKSVQLSPTPKNPLNKSKSGLCRRLLLFIIGILVILILLRTAACLLDYMQDGTSVGGNTDLYYREMGDFPKEVGQYVVAVLYQTPRDLQRMFDGVVNGVKNVRSSQELNPSMKTWESIKEGKYNTMKPFEKEEIEDYDLFKRTQQESTTLTLDESEDLTLEVGLLGVEGFFSSLFDDISSAFQYSDDVNGEIAVASSPVDKYMVETNAISRPSYSKEETAEDMTEHGMLETDAQADKPQAAEHTTENHTDWDTEVLDVMEEVWQEPTESKRFKDKFINLINDKESHNH